LKFTDGEGGEVEAEAKRLGLRVPTFGKMVIAQWLGKREEISAVLNGEAEVVYNTWTPTDEEKAQMEKAPKPEPKKPEPLRPGRSPAMAAALAAQSEGDEVKACTICGALMDEGRRKEMHSGHRRDCMRWRAEA